MKQTIFAALAATMLITAAPAAFAADAHPPKGFVKVADALKNPGMAWIPGLGTLYIDPSTLAQGGPFLGYDKSGKLVNITYMIPLKALTAHQGFTNLGTSVAGTKVDHTEIVMSKAHPGVAEEHVHVINWLIPAAEQKALGAYPLGFEMPAHDHHH